MAVLLRRLVSKKKKRYQDSENNFDLDLTYVTNRIIAMGIPSENYERFYRNPLNEVQRFLESKHKGKYKLWNLCAERHYEKSHFQGRVEDAFQFYDHEAPKMEIIIPFCKSVHEWLTSDPENVAIIHCKAGKGRTGVMICCYLLYSRFKDNAQESMDFYAVARTLNQKGVTIPSQQRYIRYCDRILQLPQNKYEQLSPNNIYVPPHPENRSLNLTRIRLNPAPNGTGTCELKLFDGDFKLIYTHPNVVRYDENSKDVVWVFDKPLTVNQDIKASVINKKGKPCLNFWFNTEFIDEHSLVVPKIQMDKAYKDCGKNIKYKSDFQAEVYFEK